MAAASAIPTDLEAMLAQVQEKLTSLRQLETELQTLATQVRTTQIAPVTPWYYKFRHEIKLLLGIRLGLLWIHPPKPLKISRSYKEAAPPARPPRISVVTPSFNQAEFLPRTLASVLEQRYPELEYIVQDGASTDGSVQTLERCASRLASWRSEPDGGQAQAINRGFARSTGEIMAWLNSDDLLLPGTLAYVAAFFARHPHIDVAYGHRIVVDHDDFEIGRWVLPRHEDGILEWADYIPQETLFWRRRIWEKVGGLDESFQFAMDWDLILRFRDAGARFERLPRFLGCFRVHQAQKTLRNLSGVGHREMNRLRERCHGRKVGRDEILRNVIPYLLRHATLHRLYALGLVRY
jgi:glycosyltransferase involved in cell wall biosynthesis